VQLANALYPLIRSVEPLQAAINEYTRRFESGWRDMMARKLGFRAYQPDSDDALTTELLALLPMVETDMTIFYRQLAQIGPELAEAPPETLLALLAPAWYPP
jgi:uncharacterized protein YdiU (UPF0061 family)